jgi:hypothetical protein
MNLIDQAKTIMQGCGKEVSIDKFHSEVCGNYSILCKLCKAKASQMLIDLTEQKEWLKMRINTYKGSITKNTQHKTKRFYKEFISELDFRLKEINSAIEILGGK